MLIPMAFPLSPGPKTDVRIARLVPKIIALEIPWITRRTSSETILPEKTISVVVNVKSNNPSEKILFLPVISPSLPNGRRKIAEESRKLLITQPSWMALACRSFAMEGSARLTAEVMNGVRKAANTETSSTDFFDDESSVIAEFIPLPLYQLL
jgi:hypothetical protein